MISFSLGENWFNQPWLVVEIFVHVFVMELSYPLEGIMSSFDSKEWRHKRTTYFSHKVCFGIFWKWADPGLVFNFFIIISCTANYYFILSMTSLGDPFSLLCEEPGCSQKTFTSWWVRRYSLRTQKLLALPSVYLLLLGEP